MPNKSTEYLVVGRHPVAGVKPGETVSFDGDAVNVQALIDGGHIAPSKGGNKQQPKGETDG